MNRIIYFATAITISFGPSGSAFAQGAGAAYTGGQFGKVVQDQKLDFKTATKVIAVNGTAELKVEPEKLRLVFAIMAEKKTAAECSSQIKQTQKQIADSISELGIARDDINGDFISVTPTYEWVNNEQEMIIRQERSGYRMQHNLHVMCKSEAVAMQVIDIAFDNGTSDIIAFDYWRSDLDEQKKLARKKAIAAAKEKSIMLFEVFKNEPEPINVQEQTTVHKPSQLYRTFSRSTSQRIAIPRNWRDRPQVYAATPQLTYLENLPAETDVQGTTPAMKPQISILSSVTIYYASPGK